MQCPVDDRLLIEYLEGELEGRAAAELGEHVAACGKCHARLVQLKRMRRSVVETVHEFNPPENAFWKENLEKVAQATWLKDKSVVKVRRRRFRVMAPVFAAAAIVVLALISTFNSSEYVPSGQQEPLELAQSDSISAAVLMDSLYMLATLAEQYKMTYRTLESIEQIGSSEGVESYYESGVTYPVSGNVYDALIGMEGRTSGSGVVRIGQ